jgi:signal transduction histidine kinase
VTAATAGSFGLGFSIARSIVLGHGGVLSLNDRQPHGNATL